MICDESHTHSKVWWRFLNLDIIDREDNRIQISPNPVSSQEILFIDISEFVCSWSCFYSWSCKRTSIIFLKAFIIGIGL